VAFLFLAVGFLIGRMTGNFGFPYEPVFSTDSKLGVFLATFFIGLGMFGVTVAIRSWFLFMRRLPFLLNLTLGILVVLQIVILATSFLSGDFETEVYGVQFLASSTYTIIALFILTETPLWAWGFLQIFCFPFCAAFSTASNAEAYFWGLYIGITLIGVYYAPDRISIKRFLRPRVGAL